MTLSSCQSQKEHDLVSVGHHINICFDQYYIGKPSEHCLEAINNLICEAEHHHEEMLRQKNIKLECNHENKK
jgi:hypothetical protein